MRTSFIKPPPRIKRMSREELAQYIFDNTKPLCVVQIPMSRWLDSTLAYFLQLADLAEQRVEEN